jgi:hypothetical protein
VLLRRAATSEPKANLRNSPRKSVIADGQLGELG